MTAVIDRNELVSEGAKTVAEAAEFVSLGSTKLYSLMDTGKLAYIKIGKSRRIPVVALRKLLADNLVGGGLDD